MVHGCFEWKIISEFDRIPDAESSLENRVIALCSDRFVVSTLIWLTIQCTCRIYHHKYLESGTYYRYSE